MAAPSPPVYHGPDSHRQLLQDALNKSKMAPRDNTGNNEDDDFLHFDYLSTEVQNALRKSANGRFADNSNDMYKDIEPVEALQGHGQRRSISFDFDRQRSQADDVKVLSNRPSTKRNTSKRTSPRFTAGPAKTSREIVRDIETRRVRSMNERRLQTH